MKLYRIIVDVQSGELLDICNRLYEGEENIGTIYSDCNGEAVIDYLKEWDGHEYADDNLREEEPRWVKNGTDHVHKHDGYTLIYNSTLGGVYMLYREAIVLNDFLQYNRILQIDLQRWERLKIIMPWAASVIHFGITGKQ